MTKKEEPLDKNDAESVVGDDLEQVLNHLDDAHSPKNNVQKHDNGNEDFQDYGETDDKPKDIPKDSDPFGLEPLIMKNCGKVSKSACSTTLTFPPGFSPKSNGDLRGDFFNACNQDHVMVSESTQNHSKENSQKHFGFSMVEMIKGNSYFDFASTSARGKSGGIICIWNSLVFQKISIHCNENYVVVKGLWTPKDVHIMWIVVYAPHNLYSKIALWSSLANIITNWNGILVTMGDFNKVRATSERYGSTFNKRNSEFFNSFISNSSQFDILLGGFTFTWTDKWGSKMSKLDRFLVLDNFLDVFPFATGVILEKGRPDHRPILLKESMVDYGPTPFRFFNSWLEMDGFHNLVTDTWNNDDIDVKIDNSCASDVYFLNRRESIKILGDIDRREASDFAQKSRIKWALEGTKILVSFMDRFLPSNGHSTSLNIELPNHLTFAQYDFLEHQCTREEIKRPFGIVEVIVPQVPNAKFVSDFWPISLIGYQYKIIGKILANRLSTVIGSCVSSEQTTFIKGRNILDGPFILNEVIEWHHKRKKELMVFKVDFEKAFDSVRWDFLDLVMEKLGFRERNPLSLFLFILVMEGLHAITYKSVDLGLFKGVSIGRDNLSISHLIYISGVSVPAEDAAKMAKIVGCEVANFPLKYLGVPVRCNMTRCAYSNPITQKFSSKLAKWKARLLSIGGRLSLIKSMLGRLGMVLVWNDTWCGNSPLKTIYPRICMLDSDRDSTMSNRLNDRDCVPIKINVFLWRVALNKLLTRFNLDRKGIEIESTLWPFCCEDVETVNHIFFSCELPKDLWALLARWWELDIPFCSNFLEWSSWLDSSHLPSKAKIFLDGVRGTILWSIWNFRNRLVFSVPPPKKAILWDSIISQSFF
nr:RNA-directed DNA polymerase, eukaryota [Tanacetum cinerariifolium]